MVTQFVFNIIAPLMLIIVMGGIGLTLTKADFLRVKEMPFAIFTILFFQIIVLPLVAFLLGWIFELPPLLRVGMLLLAATPGGASAAIYSHLAKGNVALNVTLTAVNSLIGIISVPLIALISVKLYLESGTSVPPPTGKLIQIVFVILIPMSLGMLLNHKKPSLAKNLAKYVSLVSMIFILTLIGYGFLQEYDLMIKSFSQLGIVILIFNLLNLGIGYLIGVVLRLEANDRISSAMELGLHNCVLAIGIAVNPELFNSVVVSMPATAYSVLMYVTASIFVFLLKKNDTLRNES